MTTTIRRTAPVLFGVIVFSLMIACAHAQTSSNSLQNPLSVSSIQDLIAALLKAIVEISLPILTLFIVYSGFLFVTAQGKEAQITKARDNFVYVIIGAILILGAWELANIIGGTVSQITTSTTNP